MGRVGLCVLLVGGCTPGPPLPPVDTGFLLELDSGIRSAPPMCRPLIPNRTTLVTAAQSLEGAGPFFICPAVPVTVVSEGALVFVSAYASASVQGRRSVAYARSGSQVHASADESVIVAEPGALVSVALESSAVESCEQLYWDPRWDQACP